MSNPFVGEWLIEHANPKKKFEASFFFAEDSEGRLRAILEVKDHSIDASIAKMVSPRELEVRSVRRVAMGLVLRLESVFKLTDPNTFEGVLKLTARPDIQIIGRRKDSEDLSFLAAIRNKPNPAAAAIPSDLPFDAAAPILEDTPFPVIAAPPSDQKVDPKAVHSDSAITLEEEERVWDLGGVEEVVKPTASFKNPESREFIKPEDLKQPAKPAQQNPANKLQMPQLRKPDGPYTPLG